MKEDLEVKTRSFILNQAKYTNGWVLSGNAIILHKESKVAEEYIEKLLYYLEILHSEDELRKAAVGESFNATFTSKFFADLEETKKVELEDFIRVSITFSVPVKLDTSGAAVSVDANLFSRQVDYGFGIKGRFPIQRELEDDDYYDKNGIVHNELPALLNNLMLENSLRKLSRELDMEVDEWTSESTVNSPLIWKYGFKLDEWQMYDPETDDLFPNSADLIEAYLEGSAEELRKKTLKRRLELMKEEVNKLFYTSSQEALRESMDKETTSEAERDQFTAEQLKEIEELIEENRELKK